MYPCRGLGERGEQGQTLGEVLEGFRVGRTLEGVLARILQILKCFSKISTEFKSL
jgi:hypothetical protein